MSSHWNPQARCRKSKAVRKKFRASSPCPVSSSCSCKASVHFFTALDGLRLIIGVGSLTSIVQAGVVWDHFHTNWIRIPMMGFALAGSLLNLAILRRIRRLRNHPAAQWRQKPLSPRKLRMERIQLILSWATLALIGVEELTHLHTFHKL